MKKVCDTCIKKPCIIHDALSHYNTACAFWVAKGLVPSEKENTGIEIKQTKDYGWNACREEMLKKLGGDVV